MPRLITADLPVESGWAIRLAERAGQIAQHHADKQPNYPATSPARWRDPRWLWPHFTKGR